MKYLFIVLLLVASCFVYGQRNIDMSVQLTSPLDNDIITAFIAVPISIKLTNNGPDTLKANDTIWYNTSNIPIFTYHPHILSSDIVPGDAANMQLSELKNLNSGENDQEIDFCVKVVHKDQVPGMSGGSFVDTALANNTDCSRILIKSTSIEEISAYNKICLYPNPGYELISVDFPAMNKNFIYIIYNAIGTVMEQGQVLVNNQLSSVIVSIKAYNTGAYFFKVFDEQQHIKTIPFTKL